MREPIRTYVRDAVSISPVRQPLSADPFGAKNSHEAVHEVLQVAMNFVWKLTVGTFDGRAISPSASSSLRIIQRAVLARDFA